MSVGGQLDLSEYRHRTFCLTSAASRFLAMGLSSQPRTRSGRRACVDELLEDRDPGALVIEVDVVDKASDPALWLPTREVGRLCAGVGG